MNNKAAILNRIQLRVWHRANCTRNSVCMRTRAGTNTPSDEYDTYRDTGWRIRYVSRIHYFSEAKLGNGSNMAPPNGLFRISSYVVFVIVVKLS